MISKLRLGVITVNDQVLWHLEKQMALLRAGHLLKKFQKVKKSQVSTFFT